MFPLNPSPRPMLLIVDDDPEVLRALAFMADTRGFEVAHCRTAREAIAAVQPGRRFACMVIDQMLSDDRGIELLALLRVRTKAPAILITSAPSDVLKRKAAAAGAPIVEKPLLDEMLFTEIERLTCAG